MSHNQNQKKKASGNALDKFMETNSKYINNTMFVFFYKLHRCCEICGNKDPRVLEFDHIDPSTKKFNIGNRIKDATIEELADEMAKCRILCSNCHKIHHHGDVTFDNNNKMILDDDGNPRGTYINQLTKKFYCNKEGIAEMEAELLSVRQKWSTRIFKKENSVPTISSDKEFVNGMKKKS